MNPLETLRSFGMGNLQIAHDLETVEREFGLELRSTAGRQDDRDDVYYARFETDLRRQAALMARHYEVFYCLENSIRGLVADTLEGAHGADWWESKVDPAVKEEAKRNRAREEEIGVAPRSDRPIDYVTFGQLSKVIEQHWDLFAGVLHNRQAVSRILFALNTLRSPIAHCSPLPSDEVTRLRLALEDWFRQME